MRELTTLENPEVWHVAVNNATRCTYSDDVTLVGPFIHIHFHVLREAKHRYYVATFNNID